ncbi:glycosyl transferase family 1 [Azoarcus olearius]|uniref:Glucuronyl transferase n=1 Tax=Azoarcus sp. (strain BH72) TaxID=418699 RepID=A1K7P7_AZOSB|nr:glycosyl transferase family 1 [Azoarcus olearius]ANQ85399.1 putative glucuronyl transferase [Azoarcus olearius]CAL94852.1 putative glucuronyl transferase [Azoarcus olearius]
MEQLAPAPAAPATTSPRYLVLSAHDYRTPRRASIHFIADELARRGQVRFFSLRYSALSKMKGDIRLAIDDRANQVEHWNGVDCYLWKTPVHPFNSRRWYLRPFEDAMFWLYANSANPTLQEWIGEADVVVYESGIAPIFADLVRRINPRARQIYRASDSLATINVADYVKRRFVKASGDMDVIALLSPQLAGEMPTRDNVFHVPQGFDSSLESHSDPSPYGAGLHAVSIGSMLFDPAFFEVASRAYPGITFHVIGSGSPRLPGYGDNVRVYGEMKYVETLRYIKHARFGIAPYRSEAVPSYLADSSMKLATYDYFGVPSVCPNAVVGNYASRFGYTPGDEASIVAAIRLALAAPHERQRQCLSWSEVVDRLLDPHAYPDTRLS